MVGMSTRSLVCSIHPLSLLQSLTDFFLRMDDVRRWPSTRYNHEEQAHYQRGQLPLLRAMHAPMV